VKTVQVLTLLVVLISTPPGAPCWPQDHEESSSLTELILDPTNASEYKDEEIPRFYVVMTFFQTASMKIRRDSASGARFLRSLGVDEGSPAADAVIASVFDAEEILEMRRFDHRLESQEFEDRQFEILSYQAMQLADIYAELSKNLASMGLSSQVLDDYIEQNVRPGMSVIALDGELSARHEGVSDLFDDRLETSLGQ